jgi:hypothetical protein
MTFTRLCIIITDTENVDLTYYGHWIFGTFDICIFYLDASIEDAILKQPSSFYSWVDFK